MLLDDNDKMISIVKNDSHVSSFHVAWLAISFLHCKNVTTKEESIPLAVEKAHVRHHGIPKLKYKVLEITPMKKVLEREGGILKHRNLQKAMHICRGHFKDFSQHGLFGKYHGLYWWNLQVRGSKNHGEVIKGYNINQPKRIGR